MTLRPTTKAKTQAYEKCAGIVLTLLNEMRELSKKKPDSTLSKAQVRIINRALKDARFIFNNDPKLDYLDLLEDEDLPKNADAVLIMAQYESALKTFRRDHFGSLTALGSHEWQISD